MGKIVVVLEKENILKNSNFSSFLFFFKSDLKGVFLNGLLILG